MATAKFTRAGKALPLIPKSRRKPTPAVLGKTTTDAIRVTRNCASADALRDIRKKLEVVMAVVCVSAAALRAQRADDDTDHRATGDDSSLKHRPPSWERCSRYGSLLLVTWNCRRLSACPVANVTTPLTPSFPT
jgi:hypothetical protein